jgi:hypothetical protein
VTVRAYWGMDPVVGYLSKHGVDARLPAGETLVGIELEIEDFPMGIRHAFGGFTFTNDGSLRNNGIEAITNPVAIKYVPSLLNGFFAHFGITAANYSERCSIHVHVNMQERTFEQVATIGLVYQTVERLLFKFVGNDRDQSIFCVPWCQSNMTFSAINKLVKGDGVFLKTWQKYSALNLLPLTSKGTIEFRHLHGTCDVPRITQWIALIGKIVEYADRVSLADAKATIINMNTVSNYHAWLDGVFGEYADALRWTDSETLLSTGVIDSKLMLLESKEPAETDFQRLLREGREQVRAVIRPRVERAFDEEEEEDDDSWRAGPEPDVAPPAQPDPRGIIFGAGRGVINPMADRFVVPPQQANVFAAEQRPNPWGNWARDTEPAQPPREIDTLNAHIQAAEQRIRARQEQVRNVPRGNPRPR